MAEQPNLTAVSDESADPYDLAALHIGSLADIDVEKVMTTVPVRRPHRTEFFRVHPEPDYVADTLAIEYDDGRERETYLVRSNVAGLIAQDVRPVRLHVCINKRQAVFIWPAKLPQDGNDAGRRWAESALMAAEEGKRLWVKLAGNRDLGAYEYFRAKGDLGDPQWPDKSFRDLVEMAFRDRDINRADHPVIRALAGEL